MKELELSYCSLLKLELLLSFFDPHFISLEKLTLQLPTSSEPERITVLDLKCFYALHYSQSLAMQSSSRAFPIR